MKDNETKEIEKFGQLQENGIFIMTIIGEIEGHNYPHKMQRQQNTNI